MIIVLMLRIVALAPVFQGETHYPGYISLSSSHPEYSMFYWFFRARTAPSSGSSTPLIIFMRGGPGCAGTTAVLGETGPYLLDEENLTLSHRQYSINNLADVVFVDQPLGTGFSNCSDRGRIPRDEAGVAEDMLAFYRGFVLRFPDVAEKSVYLLGLSYAGHFIPAVALRFLEAGVQVRGAAINNGWYSPAIQIRMRGEFTRARQLVTWAESALGLIVETIEILMVQWGWYEYADECEQLIWGLYQGFEHKKFNAYDIRLPCPDALVASGCYNDSALDRFMARTDVRRELGVGERSFSDCNEDIETIMLADNYADITPTVVELLDKYSLKMAFYAGDQDWVCDVLGQNAWVSSIGWKSQQEMNAAVWKDWYVNGKSMGKLRAHENLLQGVVNNAGHMVVADQPEAMMDVIHRMINLAGWL